MDKPNGLTLSILRDLIDMSYKEFSGSDRFPDHDVSEKLINLCLVRIESATKEHEEKIKKEKMERKNKRRLAIGKSIENAMKKVPLHYGIEILIMRNHVDVAIEAPDGEGATILQTDQGLADEIGFALDEAIRHHNGEVG